MKEIVLFLVESCSSLSNGITERVFYIFFKDLLGTVHNEFWEIREHQRHKRASVKVSLCKYFVGLSSTLCKIGTLSGLCDSHTCLLSPSMSSHYNTDQKSHFLCTVNVQ